MKSASLSRTMRDRVDLRAIVLLTLVWVMLWGSLGWLDVIGGVIVAVLVCLFFPLPRLEVPMAVRPVALLRLGAHFLWDLSVASASVAWTVFTARRPPSGTMFEVPLRSTDELFVATTAGMTTLVPGSVVLDIDRSVGTLLVHGFAVYTPEEQEAFRHRVWRQEELLLKALDPHAEQVLSCAPGEPIEGQSALTGRIRKGASEEGEE
ncbi:Na+/H+ antiporter subunit E [Kytococcus sedentarius]|uniref:Na+/H+ antiporter subunit E n=1 Tax=Kytococcus sedentarius TaxID=1276 RepID=UPI0035BC8772